jgi:hypothetical protein
VRSVLAVLAAAVSALVLLPVACSAGSASEQVVQSNLPSDKPAVSEADSNAAAPTKVAEAASNGKKPITSQEVENELNRLEAELGR